MVLQMQYWYTIAGGVIFRQVYKPTSYALPIYSENLPILKKDTITDGQSGSGTFFLMELN